MKRAEPYPLISIGERLKALACLDLSGPCVPRRASFQQREGGDPDADTWHVPSLDRPAPRPGAYADPGVPLARPAADAVTTGQLARLPMPLFSSYEWQFYGACADADPTVFFHPEGERGPARRQRDADALAVCATCPVVPDCRAHVLAVREPYGVWGGLSEYDREQIYAQAALEI